MNEIDTSAFADVSIVARYRGPTTSDIIEEQCYDISKGGMFVRSFNPLPNGTLIKFECRVDNNSKDIQGIGRVVWQREEDCPEAPSGMGIKFLVLRPGSPEIIESVIRKAGPMPKLFESKQKAGQQHNRERAQQRTSDRAKTLVGNQANKLATEIKRNRSAKREQLILTSKTAQKLVTKAKKDNVEKNQKQHLSQVKSAPVITITQADAPSEQSTTDDSIQQQEEPQVQSATVKAVAQEDTQQNRADETQTEADTDEGADAAKDNTARVLLLAARRAHELAEQEATMLNLEVATENAARTEKRSGIFSLKGLAFAAVTAVILLRIGFVMVGPANSEKRAEHPESVATTAQSAVTHVGIDRKQSQEEPTQALGSGHRTAEAVEGSTRPTLTATESSGRDLSTKSEQARTIETRSESELGQSQPAEGSERDERREQRKSRFAKAVACQMQGDHDCVISLLSDRAHSEKERALLAEAYRSVEEKKRAVKKSESSVSRRSSAKRSTKSIEQPTYRRTAGGIPDNPYPE